MIHASPANPRMNRVLSCPWQEPQLVSLAFLMLVTSIPQDQKKLMCNLYLGDFFWKFTKAPA